MKYLISFENIMLMNMVGHYLKYQNLYFVWKYAFINKLLKYAKLYNSGSVGFQLRF